MDEGFPGLRQKTLDACGATQETNMAPMAFNMNRHFAVVFPVLSESQRLMWMHSTEIPQLDCVAELDKAFDSFPYLTQKQTAAVAQRCSLHPDQVKVWFMLQRLRYGISWDYEDIQDVWKKLKTGQGKALRKGELQSVDAEKKKKQSRKVIECGLNEAGKVTKGHEGKIKVGKGKAAEQLERKVMQEEPINQEENRRGEKDDEEEWCPQKKRKRRTARNKIEKMTKQDGDDAVERGGEEETRGDRVRMEVEKSLKSKRNLSLGMEKRTMMRLAFCHFQYPNSEDVDHLASLIGTPHSELVQWFKDTRYYVKTRRPRWMSQEEHRQALANIQHRQNMKREGEMKI